MQYGCNSFLMFPGVMLAAQIITCLRQMCHGKCSAHNRALHVPALRTNPPYGNGVTPDQWLIVARLLITSG